MKIITSTILLLILSVQVACSQSMGMSKTIIGVDVAHNPVFWGDPNHTEVFDENRANRVQYLSSQLQANASSVGAEQYYFHDEITANNLSKCDMLFIHVPASRYSDSEVKAITDYLKNGGSLFLATDVDYWVTLEQSNVNDLIRSFGIEFGPDSTDEQVGAMSKASIITKEPVKIPYHGGRIVKGGTPFAYTVGEEEIPFAMYKELENGGKLVVMGEAMTPLYMNSWQGVDDYQTEKFMEAVVQWLID